MKKAKLFLTIIAILAVVGGALAFKAKSALSLKFCTSNVSGLCPGIFDNAKLPNSGTTYYYVVTNNANLCAAGGGINCSGDGSGGSAITTSTTTIDVEP